MKGTLHCQHSIADFPAQGRTTIGWFSAQWSFQGNFVDGISVLCANAHSKNEDQKPSSGICADIMGANLTGDSEHFSVVGVNFFQKSVFCDDG